MYLIYFSVWFAPMSSFVFPMLHLLKYMYKKCMHVFKKKLDVSSTPRMPPHSAKVLKPCLIFSNFKGDSTTGQKFYCECHFLLPITATDVITVLVLSVLIITVVYCVFYCQCCDLLSFTVLVLSVLRITVIYCPYQSPRSSPGIAPQTDYTR
jgi:hypothetical protein